MAFSTMAQSSTPRQMGPILSMVQLRAMAPWRLTRPYVGRSPTVPHTVLGETMDPSVSVPNANPTRPAEVADAEPADDPLDPPSVFHGFLVRPLNHKSPCASAPMESLAMSTAPALCRRSTQVASSSGTRSWNGSAPHVVLMPFVSKRSLTPKGMPCSGPLYLPWRISLSASAARSSARSSVSVMRQSSLGEYIFMRATYILVRAVEETARERISGAISVTGQNAISSRFEGALAVPTLGMVVSNRCGPLIGMRPGKPGWKWNAGSTP